MHPADPLADKLIVALDFPSADAALALVERLDGAARWVKVGLELYLREGLRIVKACEDNGLQVFLDLKLHDIPNTVASAVRVVADSGARLLTVHASGGPAMLAAAAEAAPAHLRLLAVTVLTSMDQQQLSATGVADTPAAQATRLGEMAFAAGLRGLVCSPEEITPLRSSAANEALLVVPGIRPAGSAADDQRRVATAGRAIELGADMLVVGRPITRAADPAAATRAILREMAEARQS